jgi:hypothetical protein
MDGLTNPLLKYEVKWMAELLFEMMKAVLKVKKCPKI